MSDYDQDFGSLPLFRTSDPETSKESAVKVSAKVTRLRAEFVRCLCAIGHPATAQEVAAMVAVANRESVRKRAAECVKAGLLKEFGTKKCSVTGQRATVYWFGGSDGVS